MSKTELKFVFHNPNTKEDTIHYITKILIEAGQKRIDKILDEYNSQPVMAESRDFL